MALQLPAERPLPNGTSLFCATMSFSRALKLFIQLGSAADAPAHVNSFIEIFRLRFARTHTETQVFSAAMMKGVSKFAAFQASSSCVT